MAMPSSPPPDAHTCTDITDPGRHLASLQAVAREEASQVCLLPEAVYFCTEATAATFEQTHTSGMQVRDAQDVLQYFYPAHSHFETMVLKRQCQCGWIVKNYKRERSIGSTLDGLLMLHWAHMYLIGVAGLPSNGV